MKTLSNQQASLFNGSRKYSSEEITAVYPGRVIALIRKYHIYPHDVLDVFQEVLFKLCKKEYEEELFTWGYVKRAVHSACMDWIDKAKYHSALEAEGMYDETIANILPDNSLYARPDLIASIDIFYSKAILGRGHPVGTPEYSRYVWMLNHMIGYTYRELVKILKLPYSQIVKCCSRHYDI